MGLHLDLRAVPFQRVNVSIPTWSKTWAFAFAFDRQISGVSSVEALSEMISSKSGSV